MIRQCRCWVAGALVALTAAPGVARAQDVAGGTITGRVTDSAGTQPIVGVTVVVPGTQRGTLTVTDGTFRLAGVAPGTVQVRAQRIGYAPATQTATVTAGGTTTLNFALKAAVTTLNEVVVTATGQNARRREQGASTATIDTGRLNLAATPTLSNVLQGRTAGVTVQVGGGTTGTASRIRIRGSNSLSLNNDPLIIVDGVYLNNNTQGATFGVGGQTTSRFDDINPEDIENIEVIKGPSAAALYGTAAANGVIQITTKRGVAGRTRWNAYAEGGTQRDVIAYPDNYSSVGSNPTTGARLTGSGCSIDRQAQRLCTLRDTLATANPLENASPFRTGNRSTFGLNASGGSASATYFLGGEIEREQGIYDPNNVGRVTVRSNVNAQLLPKLRAQVNASYLRSETRLPFNDNTSFGAISQGLLGKAFDCNAQTVDVEPACLRTSTNRGDSTSRGYFNSNTTPESFYVVRTQQNISRFVGGGTVNWEPFTWLTGVGRAGIDLVNRYDQTLTPPNQIFLSQALIEGSRFQSRSEVPSYSANVTFTGTFDINENVTSATSVGGQYLNEILRRTDASGAVLLPGTESLNGASARFTVGEFNQQVKTVGGYVEQRFGIADRFFLTTALRADNNSAFGSDFGFVYYPAVNASWVVSEEGFFPKADFLEQVRLRAAYGRSGQRPGFRQAQTFFDPVSVREAAGTTDLPAITVGGTGNVTLKPEVSSEYEGGFDVGMFGNRLSLELTGYRKRTADALVNRVLAPSLGVTLNQFANLGLIENRGAELQLNVTPIDAARFKYEANASFTANQNRILQLGEGISPIIFSFNSVQQHRGGYPAGGYFQRRILSADDLNSDGLISRVNCPAYGGAANPQVVGGPQCEVVLSDSVEYLGSPLPTREFNLNNTFTLFSNVKLTALFNYRGGLKQFNSTEEFRCGTIQNCRGIQDPNAPLAEQARAVARLMGTNAGYIEDADLVRLREVALTFALPDRLLRGTRASGASLTLAGRNLALWTDYTGFDPEVNSLAAGLGANANFGNADFLAQPPVRAFTARLSLNF